MTIICAVKDPETGECWLGSNSQHCRGDEVVPATASKWSIFGDWAIANSGSTIHSYLLERQAETIDVKGMSVLEILDFVRKAHEDNNVKETDDEQDGVSVDFGAYFILAHKDGVFGVDRMLTPHKIDDGYTWAAGSGCEFARGADHAARALGASYEQRIELAVRAAIAYDTICPGNPIVEKLGFNGV